MPQLSPLWWFMSVIMGFLLVMMLIWSYYVMDEVNLMSLLKESNKQAEKSLLWEW